VSWIQAVSRVSVTTNNPRDISNRNQPLIFLHMDTINNIVWTRESFIGFWCHEGLIFSKRLVETWWSGIHAVSRISVTTNNPRDISNRNQSLLFLHMDTTNNIVWTRKSFIGPLVSWGLDLQQKLGWKSIPWIQAVSRISVTTNNPIRDISNRNQSLLFLHIGSTNNIVSRHGRVSLALWCHEGLILIKNWVEYQCHGSKLSAEFLWPPTTPRTYQTRINNLSGSGKLKSLRTLWGVYKEISHINCTVRT
jgi:hypothetical protein